MVEKMVEKMGFLVEKEEEEGGEVVVIVVVGIEEEMEERMVEELVVKEVEGWPAKREARWLRLLGCCWPVLAGKGRRKENNEREKLSLIHI